jgi:polysaccharide export outer membrane protein
MRARIRNTFLLFNLLLPSLCHSQDDATRYHLRPGDTINIEYRYTPEFNTSIPIQPDGYATIPMLGQMKLAGMTLPQIHDILLAKASEELVNPQISVILKDFEKPSYVVGGDVANPGKFDIRGRVSALRAIEIAGGFKPFAKASQVLIIRPINDIDGQTFVIDLKRLIDKKDPSKDMDLQAGDLIIVPKTRIGKIEPYIRLINAGVYYNPVGR